ncbi:MAG: amidohydrolase family protein [Gammaproteobacteria bacterium]|nr:amidohydrolase family protein [Gammaproteobacteria bacterium]MDH4315293.1 amidohydrolase family protein [Gammaproteobacteria bacterium]MDH5213941.1 amidohydrolase family protein [Gammaproteobacteria bacterium]
MKSRHLLFAILLLNPIAVLAGTYAIVNVNVIPMTSEAVLIARTVVVIDGRIAAIGEVEKTPIPKDAKIIDGTDRYLMPGLSEMHAHVPGATSKDLDRVLGLFVANGITLIRGMLGQPSHLELREKLAHGEVLGPRLFTSGPSFNGNSVSSPAQAAEMVREQHRGGYDFLKIHPGLSNAEFHAVADTARELGMPFAGHVPEDVPIEEALVAGIATIDHLDGYMVSLLKANDDPSGGYGGFFGVFLADLADEGRIARIARETADAGVWNVPTEALFEHLVSAEDVRRMSQWPEMKYMPSGTVSNWQEAKLGFLNDVSYKSSTVERAIELRRKLILALHRAGAGLLLGSDAPQVFNVPGFSIHRELRMLVEAGLSPFEALQTGTVYPASFLNQEARFGTVQTGLDADLVLLDGNPLDDIDNSRRIHGVILGTRWLSRQDLDRLLKQFER